MCTALNSKLNRPKEIVSRGKVISAHSDSSAKFNFHVTKHEENPKIQKKVSDEFLNYLKGIVSRDFFKDRWINQHFLYEAIFQRGKLKICKVFACFFAKQLTKILPKTLFRKLDLASRPCPKILNIAPKAACDLENCSESRGLEKIDQWQRRKVRIENHPWLSEQSLEMF